MKGRQEAVDFVERQLVNDAEDEVRAFDLVGFH
jgi:hypothetical protein